jgi:hypothetical protein
MHPIGIVLIVVGLVGAVFGFLQHVKMKKILAAPFKKTGEIASNPQAGDAKGTVSTEGAIQVQQPLVAPCSGKPCIYYEIKVERNWEKQVNTENGVKTEKGWSTVSTSEQGSQFFVNDGSGPVGVDAREKVDTDLTKSFEQMQNVSYGDLVFGQYSVHVPYHGGDERTVGIRAIEKILPAEGNVFVMGKLAGGNITKQDGMLGKVLISTKGRDKLVGSTKRNSILGFVAGGLFFVGGIPAGLLIEPGKDACENMTNALKDGTCSARVNDNSGKTHEWKVTKEGVYKIVVTPTGTDKLRKLWPKVQVTKDGKDIGEDGSEGGESAKVIANFEKGTYKIKVGDVSASHVGTLKGGAGYTLDIKEATKAEAEAYKPAKKDDDDAEKEEKKPSAKEATCTDTVSTLSLKDGDKVACPKSCTTGTIYGTSTYTTDSPVCVAAVHAGVVKADKGGEITIHIKDGEKAYKGSKANGVTSKGWGKYEKSFTVE